MAKEKKEQEQEQEVLEVNPIELLQKKINRIRNARFLFETLEANRIGKTKLYLAREEGIAKEKARKQQAEKDKKEYIPNIKPRTEEELAKEKAGRKEKLDKGDAKTFMKLAAIIWFAGLIMGVAAAPILIISASLLLFPLVATAVSKVAQFFMSNRINKLENKLVQQIEDENNSRKTFEVNNEQKIETQKETQAENDANLENKEGKSTVKNGKTSHKDVQNEAVQTDEVTK